MAETFLGPDIGIDTTTGNLTFVGGDLVLITSVTQAVRIRLLTFLGEWFLDTSVGIPYLTDIFIKNPNLTHIRSLFRSTIEQTPGIDTVSAITLDFDANTRALSVVWTGTQDDTELSDVVQVII